MELTSQNACCECQYFALLDPRGANILRIVAQCQFAIDADGSLRPVEAQPGLSMEDIYWGAPGQSSVRYDSDVTLHKPHTDLIVNGSAWTPGGRAVRQMDVALRWAGQLEKRLRVSGDRVWSRGLLGWHMSDPAPFDRMPIRYERAYGGHDSKGCEPRNRCGTGYTSRLGRDFEGTAVPNIEYMTALLDSVDQRPPPAGYGSIARHWEPRLSLAGTYDDAWLESQYPLLPTDFDLLFNQCAPQDQWIARPQGGEWVELLGMTAEGHLHFQLPTLRLSIRLRYSDKTDERPMDLDTVLIEPDERLVTMTWRSTASTHGDPFRLREMIVGTASQLSALPSIEPCCDPLPGDGSGQDSVAIP